MKRLHLLRHAKSSWEDHSLTDEERPLNRRGRKASKRMARHIANEIRGLQLVVSSPARRARATLDPVLELLKPEVRIDPRLYGADVPLLLALVRLLPDEAETVMLVGHNPGLHDFADRLAGGADRLAGKYPTGALASFELDIERWCEVELGGGRLASFVRPRELD